MEHSSENSNKRIEPETSSNFWDTWPMQCYRGHTPQLGPVLCCLNTLFLSLYALYVTSTATADQAQLVVGFLHRTTLKMCSFSPISNCLLQPPPSQTGLGDQSYCWLRKGLFLSSDRVGLGFRHCVVSHHGAQWLSFPLQLSRGEILVDFHLALGTHWLKGLMKFSLGELPVIHVLAWDT